MSEPLAVEFPLGRGDLRCRLFPGFLSAAECAELLQRAAERGFLNATSHYPPSYRNNQRLVFGDEALAARFLPRLRCLLPEILDDDAGEWWLDAINPRWRSCRYAAGERFNIHQDGVFHAADGRVSKLTFMLYLNDAAEFSGGDTVFYEGPPDALHAPAEIARVQPRAGALIVFEHSLWHAGDTVIAGEKTILRSDLLYRPAHAARAEDGHQGYVFCLAALDGLRFLSGGRDCTVRLNEPGQAPRIVSRHAQSVLQLCTLDAQRFASVSRDGSLQISGLTPSQPSVRVGAHSGAALCVTRLGAAHLLTGGADAQIGLWDFDGQPLGRLYGHRGWVWDLCVLDARRMLSVSEDGRVLLWSDGMLRAELDLGVALRAIARHTQRSLIVGDIAGDLHIIEVHGDQLIRGARVSGAHSAQIRHLRALPDGSLLSAAEDGWIKRWSATLKSAISAVQREGFATDMLQLANGSLVSAGYCGGVIRHPAGTLPEPTAALARPGGLSIA